MTRTRILGLMLTTMLVGCFSHSTPPSRFYTLTPEIGPGEVGTAEIGVPIVGVGPFEFPRYLMRPQMVVRTEDNRLILNEFARWGDDLDIQFVRIAAQNVSLLSPESTAVPFPWRRHFEPDLRLVGNVNRFEADSGGGVRLELQWAIVNLVTGETVTVHDSSYRATADASDPAAIAAAMSEVLAEFSREAARDLGEAARRAAAASAGSEKGAAGGTD
jgi:uncharacterized lipoprotein YmbA